MMRFWKAFSRDVRGAVAVEFAFTGMIFIGVLLAIAQIGYIGVVQSQMEYATRAVARQIMTGQVASKGLDRAGFADLVKGMMGGLMDTSRVMIDVTSPTSVNSTITHANINFDNSGNVTNTWSYNIGTNGSIVVIQVMYRMPILLGPFASYFSNLSDGSVLMTSVAVVQNES